MLTGPVYVTTTNKEMIDMGRSSNVMIKSLVLKYPPDFVKTLYNDMRVKVPAETKKGYKLVKRQDSYFIEYERIMYNPARMRFLARLAVSQKDANTMVLVAEIDHIDKLRAEIDREVAKQGLTRHIFVVHGKMNGEMREHIRYLTNTNTDVIIIATYGVFSTGVNIKNLQNLILGSPTKSQTRILQSIGRILRLDDKDNKATIYDIADDGRYKNVDNYLMIHFMERVRVYASERFPNKVYNINI